MSITPAEGDGKGGQENRELACDQRQGVRARVRSWLQSIGQRIRELCQESADADSDAPPSERSSDHQKGEIRVSGQRRLEDPQQSSTRTVGSSDQSAVQPRLPGTGGGEAERDGNRLYDPDQPDAYITSDTWEDVER